jgi:predicted RNA-binding Zn ribbon-like protein
MTPMVSGHLPDPRPLTGEPLALDLLNTQWIAPQGPADLLATAQGTGIWLAGSGVSEPPTPQLTSALISARQAIRAYAALRCEAGGAAAADPLNAVLDHGHLRLSVGADGSPRRELEVDDPAWRPAVLAAVSLLDLLDEAPDRIRRCQHPACVLWFFDTTRNGTRRWCSMAACGNRAKAQRHYGRRTSPAL